MPIDKRSLVTGLAATLAATAASRKALAQVAPIAPEQPLPAKGQLSDPGASAEAQALYRYLCEIWGQKTLTGQQESTWHGGPRYELDYIQRVSGKQPAILGLDYIDPADRGAVNRRAIHWWRSGGIVTLCWHWGNPLVGPGYENSKIAFDVAAALTDGTAENRAMMRDLDQIAGYLAALQRARVPVIWRPFHEFTGTWFWWGQCGPDLFQRLWIKMHDHFTRERGLHNLIWILGYSGEPSAAYYPGRVYTDLIGADIYVKDHGAQKPLYDAVRAISGDAMPIALHECGPIPDPALVRETGADWLYFMVWHSDFIHDGVTNPPSVIKAAYDDPRYVTKDELPRLGRQT
jgi:mannan endo-1,4-beta-mannosidase